MRAQAFKKRVKKATPIPIVENYVKYQKVPKHYRPKSVLDYLEDHGPLPPFVIDALGENFTEEELGRLLMSMAK
jgi:predicted ThiF/HesA family dinucleotide-utilizing enzyme